MLKVTEMFMIMVDQEKENVRFHDISICELIDGLFYPNVTDMMIKSYLDSSSFVDTMNGEHNGCFDSDEIHGQRIASIITLIQNNIEIDPIVILCNIDEMEMEIEDGWHRIRAYQYLSMKIKYEFCFI